LRHNILLHIHPGNPGTGEILIHEKKIHIVEKKNTKVIVDDILFSVHEKQKERATPGILNITIASATVVLSLAPLISESHSN